MKTKDPQIISPGDHALVDQHIDNDAVDILRAIHSAGFKAYLVGGGVRDLLLGIQPKDFDIATNATPEEVRSLFRNSRIIGRRFRLVHVYFRRKIIEVATFRKGDNNVYGTVEEDALRRDFTINALYYDAESGEILDFFDGMQDLRNHMIRMIGAPMVRFEEDPVRMIRAIRMSAKLNLRIDKNISKALVSKKNLLLKVPSARLLDELIKCYYSGANLKLFALLQDFSVFGLLFPVYSDLQSELLGHSTHANLLKKAFIAADERVKQHKPLNLAFLFSILFWWPAQLNKDRFCSKKVREKAAFAMALDEIIAKQRSVISMPARLQNVIGEVSIMQYELLNMRKRSLERIVTKRFFRASYDLLLLRLESGEGNLQPVVDYWSAYKKD
ncbi:MAG: polynucleotide adenylyltransferase PcnB [Gammaproteobacteria bacterium]|nr:polynucleotide adenylyltransferase PcnB [Gammaproteobacteria bacterium]